MFSCLHICRFVFRIAKESLDLNGPYEYMIVVQKISVIMMDSVTCIFVWFVCRLKCCIPTVGGRHGKGGEPTLGEAVENHLRALQDSKAQLNDGNHHFAFHQDSSPPFSCYQHMVASIRTL